jgi:choline kinase
MEKAPATSTAGPGKDEAALLAEEALSPPKDTDIDEVDDEFDYLSYAQDRALFFWADVLTMGLVREDELPAELLPQVKKRILKY